MKDHLRARPVLTVVPLFQQSPAALQFVPPLRLSPAPSVGSVWESFAAVLFPGHWAMLEAILHALLSGTVSLCEDRCPRCDVHKPSNRHHGNRHRGRIYSSSLSLCSTNQGSGQILCAISCKTCDIFRTAILFIECIYDTWKIILVGINKHQILCLKLKGLYWLASSVSCTPCLSIEEPTGQCGLSVTSRSGLDENLPTSN